MNDSMTWTLQEVECMGKHARSTIEKTEEKEKGKKQDCNDDDDDDDDDGDDEW